MVGHLPPDLADEMIDALGANDKGRALLLYYRTSGEDLETAWQVVQNLNRDLGEEEELSKKPSQDYSFREIKDYLSLDRSARFKRFFGTLALALLFFGFPGYVFLGKSVRLKTSIQSLFWSSVPATIVKVRTYSERRYSNQRTVDRHYQDFSYHYEVDGNEHSGFRNKFQYYPGLGDKAFKAGDPISVFYNPGNPSQSLYDRKIYQLTVTLLLNLGLVGFGIIVAVFALSRERRWRRLRQIDLQISERKSRGAS